jgi:XTP/dITP diphosphohydrolase
VQLVLASANPDKAAEIAAILAASGLDVELLARPAGAPEVEETGVTLEENARLKAMALCEVTGLPAVADDTGLEVDALGGAPGVSTARYAGEDATYEDNVRKLLRELADVPSERRTARFSTVALVHWPDGREVVAVGTVEGEIVAEAQGGEGFGYDPVFRPAEGDGRTFAQMSPAEKHAVSHRGRAFRTLADALRVVEAREREQ